MITNRRSLLISAASLIALPYFAYAQPLPSSPAQRLIREARKQIGITTIYDGRYEKIAYPNGDINREYGVCTDVIIRAYRDAFNFDLQKTVHEDMKGNFAVYPKMWGLTATDSNIDHRRVPNLQTYFTRQKAKISDKLVLDNLEAGDLVTVNVPGNRPHIMMVSDRVKSDGQPLVIHNIGRGTREEDFLTTFPATGHYRFFPTS